MLWHDDKPRFPKKILTFAHRKNMADVAIGTIYTEKTLGHTYPVRDRIHHCYATKNNNP